MKLIIQIKFPICKLKNINKCNKIFLITYLKMDANRELIKVDKHQQNKIKELFYLLNYKNIL